MDDKSYQKELEEIKKAMYAPDSIGARWRLGVTAAQFAQLMDVSIRTVGRWENGEKEMTIAEKALVNKILETAKSKDFI